MCLIPNATQRALHTLATTEGEAIKKKAANPTDHTKIMSDKSASVVVITTSIVALISGFLLGVYSVRGYLISPELHAESRANYDDPVDSDETDIDEEDTVLDHAPNWANGEDADRKQGLRATAAGKAAGKGDKKKTGEETPTGPTIEDTGEECKLVLVVRTDLGMTKGKPWTRPLFFSFLGLCWYSETIFNIQPQPTGKIAAQCSHATLACYKSISREARKAGPASPTARLLSRWEKYGQAKVAVQTKSLDEMRELMGKARSLGVTAEVIQDAGRTQIEPGSLTVLGVGPAPKSVVDRVTGHLKLL